MLDRAACERRVYRLATLLTGNPTAATRVISDVLRAQPDLRKLGSARMDRLTVLRGREIPAGRIVDDRLPPSSAAALAELTHQQREAWVFSRVYELSPRDAARAMDCSMTALGLHLDLADRTLRERGVDLEVCAKDMLGYSMSLEVPEFYRASRTRRRRWRWIIWIAAVVVIIGAALVALWA